MRKFTMLAALLGAIAAFAVGAVGAAAHGDGSGGGDQHGHEGGDHGGGNHHHHGGRHHHRGHHFGHCGETSAFDEAWLTTGLQGDLFEIKGGEIAQRNSTTPDVQALGRKLVADHTESFEDGSELAVELGIEVKAEPTHSQTWELEQVGGLTGKAFDSAYTRLEVLDHEQDIEETQEEVEKGSNCRVRKDAMEELPMLKEHLELSKAAAGASA
jgi:putative membrane protein